jgi:peroxiredoxin
VSLKTSNVPLDESLKQAVHDSRPQERRVITLTSADQGTKPAKSRWLGGLRAPAGAAGNESLCRIDPTERRLVDFQLPGLDGKTVSLHEIDADLILLDFWGSWCKECRKSLPHHEELASRLGGKRLQVIGIACERGATSQDRQTSAAKAARSLGINYPVLVSSMDGSCPVQKGLQIQFYPTMLLLDRQGRIIERVHGATDVTLARIDRAIATVLRQQNDLAQAARDRTGYTAE